MFSRLVTTATAALMIAAPATTFAEEHVDADTVVATVDGTEITLGHMIVLKQRLPQEYQSLPGDVLFEGILDQLVQQTLIGREVDALSTGSQKTLENEERALRASEVITEIAADAVTEEAVQAAYDEQVASIEPTTEYNASHILFQLAPDASEDEVAAARARAEETIADLEGGADFAALAEERSEGPSAPSGGALGWFEPERMVTEFSQAVQELDEGAISEPVRTQFGWHVIRLNESRPMAPPPLEAVRGQIVEELRREAIEARIAEITEEVDVTRSTAGEIDPALLDDLSILED